MLTDEKYTILDYIPQNDNLITQLCILNFNILKNIEDVKKIINKNPKTTFWCASKDFSKSYVQTAGKMGISNIIPVPISTDLINKFFEDKSVKDKETSLKYAPLNNLKIMIVDDNDLNIKLLSNILDDLGLDIVSCNNPVEGLNLAKHQKFDLFLLDILMPEMSGFELAESIKKTFINSATPVIFVSAISGTENIMNGYNLGAYSYIEKPYHPNLVKAQIYNLLKLEAQKKSEEKNKENFIAALTHDLKSPINAEINALKLLVNDKIQNKSFKKEVLSELLNSAKYMKLITDKIICHYKQKYSKIKLSTEKTNFNKVVLSCINELKYLADEKNITIRYKSPNENIFANIDIIEIKRVINNLISNAVEYSYNYNYIDISVQKIYNDLIFEIRDYGRGINLKTYNHIFEEYVSLSKEHKKTGFGLGLHICKKIIEAHMGEIHIRSKPENGTIITFKIPIK